MDPSASPEPTASASQEVDSARSSNGNAPSPAPATTTPAPKSTPTDAQADAQARPPSPPPSPTPKPAPKPAPSDCGGSLQARINATASGGTLDLTGCTYAEKATISKPMTLRGVKINAPANSTGSRSAADKVTIDHVTITGAQANDFRWGENCIAANGSASNAISGLVIKSSTINRCGRDGMYLHYVTGATIASNKVTNSVYAGIMLSSVSDSRVSGNTVSGVGLSGSAENSNNAYGITATAEGGSPSTDVVITGNAVSNIPAWHGLDTHGGVRITFSNNTVRGVRRAIFLTSGPTGIVVSGNTLVAPTAAQRAACPSDVDPALCADIRGISVAGGSGTIKGNKGTGWPSGRWWNPIGGSGGYTFSGNSPAIP